MEKKKIELGVLKEKSKAAKEMINKAKQAVVETADQDGDGKLDLKDVAYVADQWKARQNQAKIESERRVLGPIFSDDLDKPEFLLPKMVRIIKKDKKHADSIACEGSIGHESFYKELRIVTIYPEHIQEFGVTFYPDMDNEVYYADPVDRDHYIALDTYFNYLKIARISELQRIAQDLGAKHFKVTYKERNTSSASLELRGKAGGKASKKQGVDANFEHVSTKEGYSKIEIAAEMQFIGHKPVEPVLRYFKKDPQIQNLVLMRMAENPMTHQSYTLDLSDSSGIKEKDAIKIDMALAAMKASSSISVENSARSETRRQFEYEIDF